MILSCLLIGLLQDQTVTTVSIPVIYNRPSKIVHEARLTVPAEGETEGHESSDGLLGDGVRADDLAGTILVTGNSEEVREAKQIIQQFDIPPVAIRLTLTVDSRVDHRRFTEILSLFGNEPTTISNEETGLKMSFTCRPNGDNTVTTKIDYRRGTEPSVQLVYRSVNGDPFAISPLIQDNESKKPKLPVPKMTIKLEIGRRSELPQRSIPVP